MDESKVLDFAGWLEFRREHEARLVSIEGHGEHFRAVYELHCHEHLGDRWNVQRDGDQYTLKKQFDHQAWLRTAQSGL